MSKLDEVQTGLQPGRYRLWFYGEYGIGKTTVAAAAPNSLFLDLEHGTRRMACARYPLNDVVAMADVKAAIHDIAENNHKHGYKYLWIDGIHWIEHMIHGGVITRAAERHKKQYEGIGDVGGGFGKGPALAVPKWKEFLALLESMQRKTDISVGFLGHARLGKRKNPGQVDWDQWVPLLDDKATEVIAGWCDVMAFCGFEEGGARDGDDKFARGKGWDTGDRYMHTVRSATHKAKRRLSLPDRILMVHPDEGDPWAPFGQTIAAQEMSQDDLKAAIDKELGRINDANMADKVTKFLGDEPTIDQLLRTLRKLRSK